MNGKLKLLAGTMLVLVMAGGCQKHVGGQVVAVVNGVEITQQEFNAELANAPSPPTADKQAVLNRVLQSMVDRKLLVQQAKSDGIDQSPEYLNQVMRMKDELALNLLAAKISKKISVPDKDAVAHFIAANPSMFAGRKLYALDQIVFSTGVDPKTIHDLEPAHSLDAVAAVLSSHGVQFTRGKGQLDSLTAPKGLMDRVAALPAGEPFVVQDKGKLVASAIAAVSADPTLDAQATTIAMNALRQKALRDAMQARLASAKSSAKIEYAQGFSPKPN